MIKVPVWVQVLGVIASFPKIDIMDIKREVGYGYVIVHKMVHELNDYGLIKIQKQDRRQMCMPSYNLQTGDLINASLIFWSSYKKFCNEMKLKWK